MMSKPVYGFSELKAFLNQKTTRSSPAQREAMDAGTMFHKYLIEELNELWPGEMGSNPHPHETELDDTTLMMIKENAISYADVIADLPEFRNALHIQYEYVCHHEYDNFIGRASIDTVLHLKHGAVQLWDYKSYVVGDAILSARDMRNRIHRYKYDMQCAFYKEVYDKAHTTTSVDRCALLFCRSVDRAPKDLKPVFYGDDYNCLSNGQFLLTKAMVTANCILMNGGDACLHI